MPNFGLKCFLGSFIFSLLAVTAMTRGYFLLTDAENPPAASAPAEIRNIELFAQNEETDKIYEKFKQLSAPSQVQVPLEEETTDMPESELEEGYDDISDTLAFDGEPAGDIIYNPDEEEPKISPKKENKENKVDLALADNLEAEEFSDENDDELTIADASEAPQFIIPLKHLFGTSSISGSSVSSQVDGSPTALASQNVKVEAEFKTDDKNAPEELKGDAAALNENPWDTATVANRYITKNKIAEFNNEHSEDVAALDKDKNSEARSENETEVAYKMVKNILIPIPDEIMNDENLTPQLSYSNKNKKIDANLKKKQGAQSQLKKEEKPQNEVIDEAQSKSLTESITDWFSEGSKQKEKVNIISKDDTQNINGSGKNDAVNEDDEQESSFSKLLGLKKKKNKMSIVPSELKLSFQPNRAEISGQTLEWLHAFAQNALKDDEVMVEIRIDGSSSYELQQKRLNLLYIIFANNGVNYDKINIIFTARDPNSFIIRNVKYAAENTANDADKNKRSGPWY